MDKKSVAGFLEKRFTFACAMCEHLHNAKGSTCYGNVDGRTCCGPIGGGSYPHYKGPLAGALHTVCFLTGEESIGAVDVAGVMIGVSEKAIEVLRTYSRKGNHKPLRNRLRTS